jgi:antitoxin component YwqK of YwqJK toxin-antitoxin module
MVFYQRERFKNNLLDGLSVSFYSSGVLKKSIDGKGNPTGKLFKILYQGSYPKLGIMKTDYQMGK